MPQVLPLNGKSMSWVRIPLVEVRCFIAFGSNVGDRIGYILKALKEVGSLGRVGSVSTVYESPAWGVESQPDFLNGVLELYTTLQPEGLLFELKKIELTVGRKERFRWGPREIDLDILLYGDMLYESDTLSVPHKYLQDRDFFIIPLLELDSSLVHPRYGLRLSEFLSWSVIRLKPYACINFRVA
jgi:2-amino-4-hydroxy-6-hydroxymethyldihydropteridine diphosphokinase